MKLFNNKYRVRFFSSAKDNLILRQTGYAWGKNRDDVIATLQATKKFITYSSIELDTKYRPIHFFAVGALIVGIAVNICSGIF